MALKYIIAAEQMSVATDQLNEAEARMRAFLMSGASALLVRPNARSKTQTDQVIFLLGRAQTIYKFTNTQKDLQMSRRLIAILMEDAQRRAQIIELIIQDHQIEYLLSLAEYKQDSSLGILRTKNAASARKLIKAGPVRLM